MSGALVEGKRLSSKYLVTGLSCSPKALIPDNVRKSIISRAIFISNGSIMASEKEQTTIFRIPAYGDITHPVSVIEVGSSGLVVPKELFVVYCWSDSGSGVAKKDLLPVASQLFNFTSEPGPKPKLLWSCYFNQTSVLEPIEGDTEGVFVLRPPVNELDYDQAILEARTVFSKMYPDDEFLPRAPEPEEIIMEPEEAPPQPETETGAGDEGTGTEEQPPVQGVAESHGQESAAAP
jgi:hypothetical protein